MLQQRTRADRRRKLREKASESKAPTKKLRHTNTRGGDDATGKFVANELILDLDTFIWTCLRYWWEQSSADEVRRQLGKACVAALIRGWGIVLPGGSCEIVPPV